MAPIITTCPCPTLAKRQRKRIEVQKVGLQRTAGTCHAHGAIDGYLGDEKDRLDGFGHLCRQPLSCRPAPGRWSDYSR